jgi:transposase
MLKADYYLVPTDVDVLIFEKLIPPDHYLRRLKAAIDFEPLRALVADCYAHGVGAPAEDPVRMLKLSLLQFQYDLSDSQVLRQAQVNVAFRYFLDLSVESPLPVPSLLSQFRTRLGAERFERVFHEILRQARARGLVRDRLRLKDATHLIANIAIPSTLRLVAQTREQVLTAAEPFAATEVAAHRAQVAVVRAATADLPEEKRLLARVTHLRELVVWGEQWRARFRAAAAQSQPQVSDEQGAAFATALDLAHKVLNDREPEAKDKLLSLADRDARTGKHGDYYDGYLLDVSMDADSELLCAVEVLPANGDEGANAKQLIASEEHVHGNDIASLSLDRIGYRGDVLAELSDAVDGPQLTVYVPPIDWRPPAPELFQPDEFTLNAGRDEVQCPGGATSRLRERTARGHGWRFRFASAQCQACPLRPHCLQPATRGGRSVIKTDYEAQYRAAQQRAQTAEYQEVRREHPRIERKLADLIRWHHGRRVRYRGRLRVKVQYLVTAVVVNCKRIVKLLSLPLQPQVTSGADAANSA